VIDECYKILRMLQDSTNTSGEVRNLRAHEILQELRDISSMAIEHFDEKIVPDIKKSRPEANVSISSIYDMLTSTPRAPPNFESLHSLSLSRHSSSSSISVKSESHGVKKKSKLSAVVRMYKKQSKTIKSQSKQIAKMISNLKSIKRRLDESEIKNREMTESIRQLKATASTSTPLKVEEPKKKRTATMILKRRLDE
jgi:F-box protein 28